MSVHIFQIFLYINCKKILLTVNIVFFFEIENWRSEILDLLNLLEYTFY